MTGRNDVTQLSVLHLINGLADSSINRIIQRFIQHLNQKDYCWHIGGLRELGNMQKEFSSLGAQVVDFSDQLNGSKNIVRRVRDYIFTHRIKIVHTHTPRGILVTALALNFRHHTTHLATRHGLHAPGDRRWGLAYTLLDRFTFYLPDHLVAVSQHMYRQIVAYPGISPGQVSTIRNAVECDTYFMPDQIDSCRSEFNLTSKSKVIGFVGRLGKEKRLDLLLKGFSLVLTRHPQSRLVIIGEGDLRPELETIAANLGIPHAVIWTGFRQDIPRLLALIDIYVQPSDHEGLPLSVLEAMAAGKPIIATNVGGVPEVLEDGKTGILISPGSAALIAASICDLLERPDKRSLLSIAARDYVIRNCGVKNMVEQYQHLYEQLV